MNALIGAYSDRSFDFTENLIVVGWQGLLDKDDTCCGGGAHVLGNIVGCPSLVRIDDDPAVRSSICDGADFLDIVFTAHFHLDKRIMSDFCR